ncbi:MAG TPA: hypothetical protein GX406_06385 [Pseudoclavibacter sp.]|nr:hypothetical protein [Pseudoclavibacter sp.]
MSSESPVQHSKPESYRVPFRVDRSAAPWYLLQNIGDQPVTGVTVTEFDSRGCAVSERGPQRLAPGESLVFPVRSRHPEVGTIAIVRWFRRNGDEFLWRVSF